MILTAVPVQRTGDTNLASSGMCFDIDGEDSGNTRADFVATIDIDQEINTQFYHALEKNHEL